MSNFYLAHHGIKGQRWGIRRFRNEDGTLTSAGKKRYSSDSTKNRNQQEIDNKNQEQPSTLSKARDVTRAASETIGATQQALRAIDNISRRNTTNKVDLSKMTNKELQDAITRMNLERQYQQLTQKEVSKGRQFLEDFLSIVGPAVTVTGGALSIAIAIKKLRE